MKRFRNAAVICCLVLLSATGAQAATAQDFEISGSGTPYVFTNHYGSPASVQTEGSNDFARLAYDYAGNTLNTMTFNHTDSGIFKSITAGFDFRMGSGSRADGFSFALLPVSAYGTSGGGPSFGEAVSFAGTFAVGFDIYDNGEGSNNHVSLHWNAAQKLQRDINTTELNLAGNQWLHATIVLDFLETGANVSVSVADAGNSYALIDDYFIGGLASYENRVAFGARTGGCTANHDIDNINVQYSAVPLPSTLALLVPVLLGLPLVRRRFP